MKFSLNSQVKILDDVLFQELQGEAVLLNLKTGVYLGLNQIGTRIWALLQEDGSLSKTADVLLQEYDVTRDQLVRDLLEVVTQMGQQGLLVEVN